MKVLDSFTCRKAGTWDRFFHFPSEGRHAEDYSDTRKIQKPPNSGTRGQHANHETTEATYPCVTSLAYFPSLKLKCIGLQGHYSMCVCVCVCVFVFPPLQLSMHLTVGVNVLLLV